MRVTIPVGIDINVVHNVENNVINEDPVLVVVRRLVVWSRFVLK